jgi:hypothetical protein
MSNVCFSLQIKDLVDRVQKYSSDQTWSRPIQSGNLIEFRAKSEHERIHLYGILGKDGSEISLDSNEFKKDQGRTLISCYLNILRVNRNNNSNISVQIIYNNQIFEQTNLSPDMSVFFCTPSHLARHQQNIQTNRRVQIVEKTIAEMKRAIEEKIKIIEERQSQLEILETQVDRAYSDDAAAKHKINLRQCYRTLTDGDRPKQADRCLARIRQVMTVPNLRMHSVAEPIEIFGPEW